MYCKNCGNKLAEKNTACPKCGVKLENKKTGADNNNNKNGLKTASIVLGIIALVGVLTVLLSPVSFILSIIGLILGICALKKGKNIPGIILNSIGIFISLVVSIFAIFGIKYIFENVIDDYVEQDGNIITNQDYDFSSINLDVLYENDIPIEYVIEKIDKIILNKLYGENEEMNKTVLEDAENYYNVYESYYGYTKEEFLSANGFYSEEEFLDYLKLYYKKNEYYEEYVESLITDEEIEDYYTEEVYGDINSKHILVEVSSDATEGEILNAEIFAYGLIEELNNGKSFDEIKENYKDYVTYEELGYRAFNAPLEETYLEECKNLEIGKYSQTPVLTSYGYHIVYKIDQKEKPSLKDVKEDIIDVIADQKMSEDESLYYKALIHLRKEAGFSFKGTVYEHQYDKYIEAYE